MVITRSGTDTAKRSAEHSNKQQNAKRKKSWQKTRDAIPKNKKQLVRLGKDDTPVKIKQADSNREPVKKDVMFGIRFTHPEKILFPAANMTKADLAKFYLNIADYILPFICGRPLTLVRGIRGAAKDERQFVQRHPPYGIHSSLKHGKLTQLDGNIRNYMYIEEALGLVAAVQMDTLEFHTWQATFMKPDCPDQLVFDLDPGDGVRFPQMCKVAEDIKHLLGATFGLTAFVLLTGASGLHVVCPLNPPASGFQVTHQLAEGVATYLHITNSSTVTSRSTKDLRHGKVFIDYIRNSYAQTSIVPYSTRAQENATVATPVSWEELREFTASNCFTTNSIIGRIHMRNFVDPWSKFFSLHQTIPETWESILSALFDGVQEPLPMTSLLPQTNS